MLPEKSRFLLSADTLQAMLDNNAPPVPEILRARQNLPALRSSLQAQRVLQQTADQAELPVSIPVLTYSAYRLFRSTGDRQTYETPYFTRRGKLAAAALRLFLGDMDYLTAVQDLLWAICEETTWALAAHENDGIDLFAAETAYLLAETLLLVGDALPAEIRSRVYRECDRRVFAPYLENPHAYFWYQGGNNWNGVCNSSVAASFLLLEPDLERTARALELALRGLGVFFARAFETDGASTEGVAYWNYGLIHVVALAEMLRARTNGALDLLDTEQFRRICAYPAKLLLAPGRFASFSDCDELLSFSPGMITRLVERSGDLTLRALLSEPAAGEHQWRLSMLLRDLLWWDGKYEERYAETDAFLPSGGVVRLVDTSQSGAVLVAAVKAGHNAENHNQNDVGSFLLHAGRETFLVDPGRGLYSRQYFSAQRYENIFASSYGHSLPVIGGHLQKEGPQYRGEIVALETGAEKFVEVEFAQAYPVTELTGLRRRLTVQPGSVLIEDSFRFSDAPLPVEEVFVTWMDVQLQGSSALLLGQENSLRLSILAPAGAVFSLELCEQASRENRKPQVLKRLKIALEAQSSTVVRVQAELV